MRRTSGFTLIELMVTMAIVAILAAVAFPSYQQHVIRAIRSQGQQFLSDLAQREEQYFLDARSYAIGIAPVSTLNMITMSIPDQVAAKYNPPVFVVTPPPAGPNTFLISLTPIAGGTVSSDGVLYINNLGQRWREVTVNGTYDGPPNDCLWENQSCIPH